MDFNFKYTNRELEVSNDNTKMILHLPDNLAPAYLAYCIKNPSSVKRGTIAIIITDKEIIFRNGITRIKLDYHTYADKLYNEIIKSGYNEKDITSVDVQILDSYHKYKIVFTNMNNWNINGFYCIPIIYNFDHDQRQLLSNALITNDDFVQSFSNGQCEISRKNEEILFKTYYLYPGRWYSYVRFMFPNIAKENMWSNKIDHKDLVESMKRPVICPEQ